MPHRASVALPPTAHSHLAQQLPSAARSRQSVQVLPSQSYPSPTPLYTSSSAAVAAALAAAPLSSAGPYPTLYQPHPMPKQKVYFGPYILLQTLGEGEFGKVKLGVHSEKWGEEVAIKLIKRGNVDTKLRGEKVRREIEVLKAVRHPNIVRLYDVIETEKYIGIVLEYASGGELFDHILAHRYLKERDASRLFAQLVSGVSYLHSKHIVHRDLKLENLLLDRQRNVIITDFGFANRFEDVGADLMSTSCGSPCYAAPELVVQEGRYVGTAVDVWSCGVILYAMLAGYLPYDDDPSNPEGDNINLLYKYIINTKLSFPDWITEEPRNLLLMMLVPNPDLRCKLSDVIEHPWLAQYINAFRKSTWEMEGIAKDEETHKREKLEAQREFLVRQRRERERLEVEDRNYRLSGATRGGGETTMMTRSQSSVPGFASTTSASRHRSAVVTSSTLTTSPLAYSTPLPSSPTAIPVPNNKRRNSTRNSTTLIPELIASGPPPSSSASSTTSSTRSKKHRSPVLPASLPPSPTIQSHPITVEADKFSFDSLANDPNLLSANSASSQSMEISFSAPSILPPVAPLPGIIPTDRYAQEKTEGWSELRAAEEREKERKRANRVTVQVEYDGSHSSLPPPRTRSRASETRVEAPVLMDVGEEDLSIVIPETEAAISASTMDSLPLSNSPIALQTPPIPSLISAPTTPPLTATLLDPTTPQAVVTDRQTYATNPVPPTPARPISPTPSAAVSTSSAKRHAVAAAARHKKGLSTDRFSLRNILGGSTTSPPPLPTSTSTLSFPSVKAKDDLTPTKEKENGSIGFGSKTSGNGATDAAKALDEVTNERRKSRRQKAMSLQPFSKNTASKIPKLVAPLTPIFERLSGGNGEKKVAASGSGLGSNGPTNKIGSSSKGNSKIPSPLATPFVSGTAWNPAASTSSGLPTSTSVAGSLSSASTGRAKMVMDWFRRKSVKGADSTPSSASPLSTEFDRTPLPTLPPPPPPPPPAARVSSKITSSPAPSVVVTSPHSQFSTSVSNYSLAMSPNPSNFDPSIPTPIMSSSSTFASLSGGGAGSYMEARIRTHQGALDKSAVTSRAPRAVMEEIRNVLWEMGIEASVEGDFKLKCVRKSRKKALAATSLALSPTHGSSTVSINSSALRANATTGGSLTASPSGGFRSFFTGNGRKNSIANSIASTNMSHSSSTTTSNPLSLPSPSLSATHDPLGSTSTLPLSPSSLIMTSPLQSETDYFKQPLPTPIYGNSNSTDTGEEVRFAIELTKIKNLDGLFCVEVKRMRGGPWSYKFVYDKIFERVSLGGH